LPDIFLSLLLFEDFSFTNSNFSYNDCTIFVNKRPYFFLAIWYDLLQYVTVPALHRQQPFLPMLRIPNRQNPLLPLYCAEFSVQKIPHIQDPERK